MTWELRRSMDPLVVTALLLSGVVAPRFARADNDEPGAGAGTLVQKCESDHDGVCVELDMRQDAQQKSRSSSGAAPAAKKSGTVKQTTSSSHSAQGTPSRAIAAPRAAKPCEGKWIDGRCVLEFENDKLDGTRTRPRIARIDTLIRPKTDVCSFEREQAYRLIREGRDSSQAEKGLTDCYERVTQVSIQLDRDVSSSMHCPKDFNDVEVLRELQKSYDEAPKKVDLSGLIVFPLNPDSTRTEPHLPYTCGYNQSSKTWFSKTGFHCTDNRHCYNQSHREAPLNGSAFEPLQDEPNLWKAADNALGARSYRDGGLVGDLRVVRLSDGLYLQTYRKGSSVYYLGLIVVPSQRNYLKRACELETSHEAPREEIAKLIVRGDVLEETRTITARLAQDVGMAETERVALRSKAEALMATLEGKEKATIGDEKASESACARLAALDGRASPKTVRRKQSRDKLMDEILSTTEREGRSR